MFVVCKLCLEGNLFLISSPTLLLAVMKCTSRPNLELFSKSFWAMCLLKLTVKPCCYQWNLESFCLSIALQQGLAKILTFFFSRLLLLMFKIMFVPWRVRNPFWCTNVNKQQFLKWMKLYAYSNEFVEVEETRRKKGRWVVINWIG